MADKFDVQSIGPSSGVNDTVRLRYKDMGDGTYAIVVSAEGATGSGGGSEVDRELAINNFRVVTAFAGASVGDVISSTRLIDVSGASPVQVGVTQWFNDTTQAALANAPDSANFEPIGASGITNAQMVAALTGLATSAGQDAISALMGAVNQVAPATDTASSGLNGRLQRIAQRLTSLIALLPESIGVKTAAGSLSVAPASDATFVLGAGMAHIGGVSVDDVTDAAVTSGSVTSTGVVVSASTAGFAGGSFQVTSAGVSATLVYEQSNDGVNWQQLYVINTTLILSSPSSSSQSTGIYGFIASSAYVRVRVSTYNSGTVSVVLTQKRIAPPLTGTSLAGGNATIGAITGNTNTATGYSDSSTALGASAIFTGTARAFSTSLGPQYSFFNAQSQADQAGTLYIEASYDTGATYIPVQSVAATAVTNAAGTTYYVAQARATLTGLFTATVLYRVVYKNGATAQAAFRITSSFTAG